MEQWRRCAQWMVDCAVLPAGHRVLAPDSEAFTFAQTLRDGVLLCQLVSQLDPTSIDLRTISLKPQMSQFLCLRNIKTFLSVCGKNFGMKQTDLFDGYMLFDVSDFGKVVVTLSKLSQTPKASRAGIQSFCILQENCDDDVYKCLEDIAGDKDLEDEEEELYAQVDYPDEDEDIYSDLCSVSTESQKPTSVKSLSQAEKRDCCVSEMLETEKKYVEALNMITVNFIRPMKNYLTTQDMTNIFMNIQKIYTVHVGFLSDLSRSIHDGASNISKVYVIWKKEFTIYGYYCANLLAAQKHVEDVSRDQAIKSTLEECQMKANNGKFRLRDLLALPMQRVLKYPLLLKELTKHTLDTDPERDQLESALSEMHDLSLYINEEKRDSETLDVIKSIENSILDYNGKELREFGRNIKDGELKVRWSTDNQIKNRYVFLFQKALVVCKSRLAMERYLTGDSYTFKELIYLSDHTVADPSAQPQRLNKWTYSLVLFEKSGGNVCTLFTRTEELQRKWLTAIQTCMDTINPPGVNSGNHRFQLSSFESAKICAICSWLLRGAYYQGFKCQACGLIAHKDCLPKSDDCKAYVYRGVDVCDGPPLPPRDASLNRTPTASPSIGTPPLKKVIFMVATAPYSGTPAPDGGKVALRLSLNERVELLDKSDRDWWRGKSIKTQSIGYFPSKSVQIDAIGSAANRGTGSYEHHMLPDGPQPEQVPVPQKLFTRRGQEFLNDYSWFVGQMERDIASQKLDICPDGSFLVRESVGPTNPGMYAISLKYGRQTRHIRIDIDPDSTYRIGPDKCFVSVPELVEFYRMNSLVRIFPAVPTVLRHPFKEVHDSMLRVNVSGDAVEAIAIAQALYAFEAREGKELSLNEGDVVRILNQHGGGLGWWKGELNGRVGYFPKDYVELL